MIFRFFFRVLDLFYQRTELGQKIPGSGPLLLVANHPNGLIDPIVLAQVARRSIKTLAKEPLFHIPILGWIVRNSGAIPIYRAQDGHENGSNNRAFDAVHAELAVGGAVALFPEGVSHNEPGLLKLKTGAARMALGAEALAGIPMGTRIIPVGMVYRNKARFRSSLAVEVGEAIEVASFAEAWKQDEREATIALTKEIERGLRSVILDLEQWEDLPLLHFASDIIATDQVSKDAESGHRIQQLRSLAQFGREKATSNPRALSLLRRRLNEFRGRLKRLGLEVRHLDADYTFGQVSVFVSTNLFAIFVGLPAAIIGAVFWVVPWAMTHLAVKLGRIEQDIVATIKVLAACLVFPPWIAVALWKSPLDFLPSAGVLVVLASCGLYARHFLRRRGRAWREARAFMLLPSRKKLRKHLCRERDELRIMLQR